MVKKLGIYIAYLYISISIFSCVPGYDFVPDQNVELYFSVRSAKPLTVHLRSGDSLLVLHSIKTGNSPSVLFSHVVSLPISMNQDTTEYEFYYPDFLGNLRLTCSRVEVWNNSGLVSLDYQNLNVDSNSTFKELYESSVIVKDNETDKYYLEYSDRIDEPDLLHMRLEDSRYSNPVYYINEYL